VTVRVTVADVRSAHVVPAGRAGNDNRTQLVVEEADPEKDNAGDPSRARVPLKVHMDKQLQNTGQETQE